MIIVIVLCCLILLATIGLGIASNKLGRDAVADGVTWSYSVQSDDSLSWDFD